MVHAANLDEHVRETLRQKIITGNLEGGYHLSELKISKEFNVSRTPVREALCALAADGLIEMVPHRGAFVTNVPCDTRVDQLKTYGLFMALAARLATENGQIELIMDLETAISALKSASDEETYTDALAGVNATLRQACGSATVQEALDMVARRTDLTQLWQHAFAQKDTLNKAYTSLLSSLKKPDVDGAEQAMRQIMDALSGPALAKLAQADATVGQIAN